MKNDIITGVLESCYNGIPVIRGYCSYKTLIKHSKAHEAYQRTPEDKHVEEIKEFIEGGSFKFMPEVVLSYDYKGIYECDIFKKAKENNPYLTPVQFLMESIQGVRLEDSENHVSIIKLSNKTKGLRTLRFVFDKKYSNNTVFNRLDGNHRLQALEEYTGNDFQIPFCIVLLNGNNNPELKEREKMEMAIFHNINSKAKPLTPIEQYKGLFGLFSVDELESYGKEFSSTKAYLKKHDNLILPNIAKFLSEKAELVLYCIKYFLDRNITFNEDDLAEILSELNHTYFSAHKEIRDCKNKYSIMPYVYYCYNGGKKKNAKLTAYNQWFIKNKLYRVKDIDPASIIDVFDSIYDIRKKQIFVAMPFKPELDFVFDAICDTVRKINQDNETEWPIPVRIDKQIIGHTFDIVDELLNQIKNAGLLIADLTDQNANVYYEAGFAQGLLRSQLGNTAEILYLISNAQNPDAAFDEAKFDLEHYKIISYKNDGNGVIKLKDDLEKELKAYYGI